MTIPGICQPASAPGQSQVKKQPQPASRQTEASRRFRSRQCGAIKRLRIDGRDNLRRRRGCRIVNDRGRSFNIVRVNREDTFQASGDLFYGRFAHRSDHAFNRQDHRFPPCLG